VHAGIPLAGEIAIHPVAARSRAFIGGAQVEHHGDAAACAAQLADIVGGDGPKAHHAGADRLAVCDITPMPVGGRGLRVGCLIGDSRFGLMRER